MLVVVAVLAIVASHRARFPKLQRRSAPDEVRFLAAVVAALRAGHTVRAAIATAAGDEPQLDSAARVALAGAPMPQLGKELAVLPTNGQRIGSALQVLETTGGKAGAVFERLLDRAVMEADLDRQRRALTAQARAAAAVVGSLPIVVFAATRGAPLASLARAGGIGLGIAVAAVALQAVGLFTVWRLAR